jgi:Fic family protein
VQEARNALVAYEQLEAWQPASEQHLLDAHALLMKGLIDDAGHYRHSGVGVMKGDQVLHMAPPANRVSKLMRDLLQWLEMTNQPPLIASCVFHYEFEFIHPFADGNGRMGRLWQTLILNRWQPLFAHVPVESLVHAHQAEYYAAINHSTQQADSAPFIEFMLSMLRDAILSVTPQVAPQVTPQVGRLLLAIKGEMSREALQDALDLQDRKSFRERYLKPALTDGLIEMTIPDKPNSRLQKYRLTDKGRHLLQMQEEK